jgi:hypothetical protein
MKNYAELFLGLMLAGLLLITAAFVVMTTPAVLGSGTAAITRVVADGSR